MNNNFTFPAWYESTTGPGTSQTIMNILGGFLPMLNMFLASKGIKILPESIEPWVNLSVFIYFSVRAMIGYVKAKRALGSRIAYLEEKQNIKVGVATANAEKVWYGPHPCEVCEKNGHKDTMIVKAGSDELDFVHDSHYPNHRWSTHVHVE